jgi:hypothetical protein
MVRVSPLNPEGILMLKRVAASQGFEPRYSAPEADVLPLNDEATVRF